MIYVAAIIYTIFLSVIRNLLLTETHILIFQVINFVMVFKQSTVIIVIIFYYLMSKRVWSYLKKTASPLKQSDELSLPLPINIAIIFKTVKNMTHR